MDDSEAVSVRVDLEKAAPAAIASAALGYSVERVSSQHQLR